MSAVIEQVLPDFVVNDTAFPCARCGESVKTYYVVTLGRKINAPDDEKVMVRHKLCGPCVTHYNNETNGGGAPA